MLKSLKKILQADPKNFYSLQFTHSKIHRHTNTYIHRQNKKNKSFDLKMIVNCVIYKGDFSCGFPYQCLIQDLNLGGSMNLPSR